MTDDDQTTPADPDPDDPTPVGDSPEHADDDAERGGTGAPTQDLRQPSRDPDSPPEGRFKRDQIGGEGEGTTTIDVGE